MQKTNVGNTHAAHEMRYLSAKMELVRDGRKGKKELESLEKKVKEEREQLMEKYYDGCSYLGIQPDLNENIPKLSKSEAAKHAYLDGLVPIDYICISKLQMHNEYGTPAPTEEHLHTGIMLLKASINELTWALGELRANIDD